MIALIDNTVLTNFSLIQRSDLVRLALGNVAATVPAVFNEYATGVRLGRLPATDWQWLPILDITQDEADFASKLASELGLGEASCIACAFTRGFRVFTDDRDARRVALQLSVPISGTLGMLLLMVEAGALSESKADECLSQMIAYGYRSPVTSLRALRRNR